MNNLNRRIANIEKRIDPSLKILVVIVDENDTTCEAATQRVMKEKRINIIPPNCTLYIINTCRKPAI